MALQYELVRATLIVQILAFLAFETLPIPKQHKKRLVEWIRNSPHLDTFISFCRVLFAFIGLLFLDAMVRSAKLSQQFAKEQLGHVMKEHLVFQGIHAKMFYAQRNLYLTGFTLALAFVLSRYAKRVCAENALTDRVKCLEETSVKRRSDTVYHKQRVEELEEELEGLRAKVGDAEASLKQAEAQQAEYYRLADRYNELERRLNPESPKSK